jgi:hypothetical protein
MAPVMPHRDSRARAVEALRLRARRKTWQEIADELGFRTRAGARLAVTRLLRSDVRDPAAERAVSVEKLRTQEAALFDRFEAAVRSGDDEMALSLSKELRLLVVDGARIDGHFAPQRTQVDVHVHQTPAAIIADARERLLSVIDAEVIEAAPIKEIAW